MSEVNIEGVAEQAAHRASESIQDDLKALHEQIAKDHRAETNALRQEVNVVTEQMTETIQTKIETVESLVSKMQDQHRKDIEDLTRSVASVLTEGLSELSKGMTSAVTENVNTRLKDQDQQLVERNKALATAIESATKAQADANDLGRRIITGIGKRADEATKQLTQGAATAEGKITELSEKIDRAVSAVTAAKVAETEAKQAQKEAEAVTAKAEKDREHAEHAVRVMTARANAEVERNIAEIEFKAREKQTYEQLKADREAMGHKYDLLDDEIQRRLDKAYPELATQIEEAVANLETESEEE